MEWYVGGVFDISEPLWYRLKLFWFEMKGEEIGLIIMYENVHYYTQILVSWYYWSYLVGNKKYRFGLTSLYETFLIKKTKLIPWK